ncbi:hypothetical protein U1Q18_002949 [Sarracenia purpurea var. burkii]
MALVSSKFLAGPINQFPNPNPNPTSALCHCSKPLFVWHRNLRFSSTFSCKIYDQSLNSNSPARDSPEQLQFIWPPPDSLRRLAASAILFLGLGIRVCLAAASSQSPAVVVAAKHSIVVEEQRIQGWEGNDYDDFSWWLQLFVEAKRRVKRGRGGGARAIQLIAEALQTWRWRC